jgi:hypothetical protein
MTNKTIIVIFFVVLTKFSFSQTDTSAKIITKTGYGTAIIGQTLIQDIVKTTESKLTMDSITYLWGLANMGGGCIRIERTKKFYRYKDLGITYIVSSGDTISGIIFYPPFSGQTGKGEIIGKTKITSLDIPKKDNKIIYSHPDAMGLHRDKIFSENAKHYISIDGIHYGFKNKRKTITEIRIGQ